MIAEESGSHDLPLGPTCPQCGRSTSRDDNFCAYCGRSLEEGQSDLASTPQQPIMVKNWVATLREIVGGIGTYTILSLLIITFLYLAILIWSLTQVIPSIGSLHTYLYIITPWIVNFAELGGPYFAAYYVLIVFAVIASFVFMMWVSASRLVDELSLKPLRKGHSPLYVIGTLYFAALSFNLLYYVFIGLLGVNPTVPTTEEQELWKVLYVYARAGVWEEIVSRLLLIGVPLLVFHSITKKRDGWKKYVLGGGFSFGRAEIFFLLFSSAMFAAAHVFTWDIYKIPPTFIGGLAFGYLFLRFGLYASILIHFAWDYVSVPVLVFPGYTSTILIGLLIIAWVAIGAVYFVYYSSKIAGFILGRKVWPDSVPTEVARPTASPRQSSVEIARNAPGWGTSMGFQFVCRYCGHKEARYRDGGFECTRCGRRS